VKEVDFQHLVEEHYEGLYRFALSLSHRESEACDLTQETFLRWAVKGHQLKDKTKAKTWLYTTLYREFLYTRRRTAKFPQVELEEAEPDLPSIEASMVEELDAKLALEALMRVEELYRAPLALFYLEQHSYQEIAGILDVPMGTVMSRLSRGKKQLRALLQQAQSSAPRTLLPFPGKEGQASHG
jgi:RNA polymerase sigma-70 factor (ECF subfamily)